MNRLVTTVAAGLVTIAAMAQENADIEVSYTVSTVSFREGGNAGSNQYILLANPKDSKFYSPRTEFIDSLRSTPEGEAKYQEMTRTAYRSGKLDDIPRRDGSYYLLKSTDSNTMKYYDVNGIEKYCYEEDIPEIDWELGDDTKKILGYECQMATGNLHGRKWTAWFTTEVPLMNGPWKLGGLPGLILEAVDDSGLYTFKATGIQQTLRPITPVYSADEYEKLSRVDFLKAKRQFIDNPLASMNAQLGGLGITIGDSNTRLEYKSREEIDFIETDY